MFSTYIKGWILPLGVPSLPTFCLKNIKSRGTRVAQLVKRPTLDFSSGHDLRHQIEPCVRLRAEQGAFLRSLPLPVPHSPVACAVSLKKKKSVCICIYEVSFSGTTLSP